MTIPSTKNGYQALPAEDASANTGGRTAERKKKTWFERNFHWILYLKIIPSMVLIGTFGRRPITIANLVAAGSIDTVSSFMTILAAPILVFAFLDTFYIALTVYEENWKIKQLQAKEKRSSLNKSFQFDILANIHALRDRIGQLPYHETTFEFIKNHIFDDSFKFQLHEQNIDEDVFIDHLMRKNDYNRSHKEVAEKYIALTKLPNTNYQKLWLSSQIDLIHALLTRYEHSYQKIKAENNPESLRTFILSNIFYYRLRTQLQAMGIDENKLLDALLAGKETEQIASTFERIALPTPFDFGKEWLKTEIKLMRMHPNHELRPGFTIFLKRAGIPNKKFMASLRRKSPDQTYRGYSSEDIAQEFRCLTTEKSFDQEHPWVAKNIKHYENLKKVLVFPLRTIGLMLVMESLFPFALPLATGLVVYAVAGLAISLMIITLEKATDGTLKKLKNARNEDLKKLHMAEQVGTIDRLELRAEKYIPSFSTQKMLLIQGPLSPNSSPKSESPPANFLSHSASECDLHKRRLEATNC